MAINIRKINVSNFKSIRKLQVELGDFNVLIGANASGKSNFIQLFKFLRDIVDYGLDNAISMQAGGIEYLRNIGIGSSEDFSIEVVSDQEYGRVVTRKKDVGLIGMRTYETAYELLMEFSKNGLGFQIGKDRLTQAFNLVELQQQKAKLKEGKELGSGKIVLSNVGGKVEVDLSVYQGAPIKKDDLVPPFLTEQELGPRSVLLERSFFFMEPFMYPLFTDISIYDFDPKLPKKATPITGKAELEEDGSNLAIVLKNIIEDKEKKRKFANLIRDLLPFVDELEVEKFLDKSLLFKLRETYDKKHFLPASLISDGTINIAGLIIALYFEGKRLTIIEEPERNIHPYLISKIVEMMKEASKNKQVIASTHNPEMVRHTGLENILLVSRDKEGFTTISRPHEKEVVKAFLRNELGIEELYVQNMLEF